MACWGAHIVFKVSNVWEGGEGDRNPYFHTIVGSSAASSAALAVAVLPCSASHTSTLALADSKAFFSSICFLSFAT